MYYGSVDLIDRICNAVHTKYKSVTFLVGSALSLPDRPGGPGVPGVSGMVDLIRAEFAGTAAHGEFDNNLRGEPATRYQRAFEFLHGRRGPDVANRIVRTAVWNALNVANWPSSLLSKTPDTADSDTCHSLERHVDAWHLPRGVDLLGSLLANHGTTLGRAVLTTNFDPLIEVSVSKHGGQYYRTALDGDGSLEQTVGDGTHIVHLHGYWHGYDTLHMPHQLVQPRPQVGRSLARVVASSTLVVIGYSGWDDVVIRTLSELLSDSVANPEIRWAFHDDDPEAIDSTNARLLSVLAPGIDRGRVTLYQGIDCCALLSAVSEELRTHRTPASNSLPAPRRTRPHASARTEHAPVESESPLFVEPWVGRDQELGILASSITPVAFVTGIGGQGKSALAGRFLKQYAVDDSSRFEVWDWRDCREESDRLNTQLLRLVERLSSGATDVSQIEVANIKAVVGILFNVLRNQKALLVFDNVDQYVDLVTLQPIKGLDVLVSEAQTRNHRSFFLFTCRPDVRVDESRAVRVPLTGLTRDQTRKLVMARGIPKKDHSLAKELHRTTDGHPLWMNLVVMQALRHENGLRGALDLIAHGGATLPDTTRTIWGMLNEHQRSVLRTMAELDRSEPKSRLLEILPGINVNRVNRALTALQSFHLIETRTQAEGEPLLGLHPIIRQFVRTTFPMRDREKHASAIYRFLDGMIARFKKLLQEEPSYEILEPWTRKAELQITFRRFAEATSTISEVVRPLVNRGYSEEFIRLATLLFAKVDWAEACTSYKDFDTVFYRCLETMIEFGHEATENLLTRYEGGIPGKSSQFIMLCDLRCYAEWYAERYDSAIRWGREGKELKERTAVDTAFSTEHHLALALRDAGQVPKAVESFLGGERLEELVTPGKWIHDKEASFYGNIGRCLFLIGRLEGALVCYVKSAQLLEKDHEHGARLNKGYIRFWIAELLVQQAEYDLASALYRAAACMWDDCSPPRSERASERLEALMASHPELDDYSGETNWKAEKAYVDWLGGQPAGNDAPSGA